MQVRKAGEAHDAKHVTLDRYTIQQTVSVKLLFTSVASEETLTPEIGAHVESKHNMETKTFHRRLMLPPSPDRDGNESD